MQPPASSELPILEIHLSPGAPPLDPAELLRLEQIGLLALPACLDAARPTDNVLCNLSEIEITLMSDSEIASVHGEFLDDPTPTDVITFHHGEILISVETATRQAASHGLSTQDETALYLIHGLLHLAGWDDHNPDSAAAMASLQQNILNQTLKELPTSV
jgi:probable rRNA maturation factor